MSLPSLFKTLTSDPLAISRREQILVALAGLVAIFFTGILSHRLLAGSMPFMIASMGASSALVFVMAGSPLAQPWPLVGGHLISACIGVGVPYLIPDTVNAAATAAGLSILFMLALRCFHPPGTATALAPILSNHPDKLYDLQYVLTPVVLNVLLLLALTIIINRWVLKRNYPLNNQQFLAKKTLQPAKTNQLSNFYKADIQQAIVDFDNFLDISYEDLSQLFTQIQLNSFKRHQALVNCASIMTQDIITVNYDTEVEYAWNLMQQHNLKALPVLDRARRVIGIVTQYDFFKYVKLTPYASFQEKFLNFLKKSTDITTTKPEAIGHIMSRNVASLSVSSPIEDIMQLMVNDGHRHIPIVDREQRFVGMIFQRNFISALFHSKTTFIPSTDEIISSEIVGH